MNLYINQLDNNQEQENLISAKEEIGQYISKDSLGANNIFDLLYISFCDEKLSDGELLFNYYIYSKNPKQNSIEYKSVEINHSTEESFLETIRFYNNTLDCGECFSFDGYCNYLKDNYNNQNIIFE